MIHSDQLNKMICDPIQPLKVHVELAVSIINIHRLPFDERPPVSMSQEVHGEEGFMFGVKFLFSEDKISLIIIIIHVCICKVKGGCPLPPPFSP